MSTTLKRVAVLVLVPLSPIVAVMALTALVPAARQRPAPAWPVAATTVAGAHDPTSSPRVVVADGLWEAGPEMAPGTWFAYPADGSCVWTVRADDTPEGFVSGGSNAIRLKPHQAVYAKVSAGQWFETVNCGTWVKVEGR